VNNFAKWNGSKWMALPGSYIIRSMARHDSVIFRVDRSSVFYGDGESFFRLPGLFDNGYGSPRAVAASSNGDVYGDVPSLVEIQS